MINVTDALTHATGYGYDTMNRLASRTDPLARAEYSFYDVDGNPSQRIDRKGQITTRTYDALNRLSQITYNDQSTITYTYDSGNRLRVIDDSLNGRITRTYDGLDRLLTEATAQGTVTYTYDKADRRVTMTVQGQPPVVYGNDAANRLTSISQGTSVMTIAYDDANRRSTLTLPNGIVTTYGYDNASQLTDLTYTMGATTLGNLTYTYDPDGRRIATGGTWARTGMPEALSGATFDAGNRVQTWNGQPFSYDPNGNLGSDGLTSLIWDARDHLTATSGTSSTTFAYDAIGRRWSKTIAGTTTRQLFDGFQITQEISTSGAPLANLLNGAKLDELYIRTEGALSSSIVADGLGSTLAVADDAGNLTSQYVFEPFGRTARMGASSTNAAQFAGGENDGSLYNFRARYYLPDVARFTSEDPVREAGGLNLFEYANNNPISFVDPTGLTAILYCEAIPRAGYIGHHCYIEAECPGEFLATMELWGPDTEHPHGRPVFNARPDRSRNSNPLTTHSRIRPPQDQGGSCPGNCSFENALVDSFLFVAANWPWYDKFGPNSNTFADTIIRRAGGSVTFPPLITPR